jgi:hypothetical protein
MKKLILKKCKISDLEVGDKIIGVDSLNDKMTRIFAVIKTGETFLHNHPYVVVKRIRFLYGGIDIERRKVYEDDIKNYFMIEVE